jgi:hypothetical protein
MSTTESGRPALAVPRSAGMLWNFVAFQCGWFACVLGAARGWPWVGLAATAVIAGWHVARATRPAEEMKLIGVALAIGVVWDSAHVSLGWIRFTSGTLVDGIAPPWILALWALFATTLNVSLGWLKGRWLVAVLLGAAAGPLSYWAGARLGAVEFVVPVSSFVALALGWAVMTPLLVAAARRFDGIGETR